MFIIFSQLYQIAHLGDNDDEPEFSSRMPLDDGETFFYDSRNLQNLVPIDQIDNLSPAVSTKVTILLIYTNVYCTFSN